MLWKFSKRAAALQSSAIREILKVTEQPDMISFAGGLPSANTFPVAQINQAVKQVMLSDEALAALQYSPTEGFYALREWIANHFSQREGTAVKAEQVLIVTGSQQALDLLGKALIDPGSQVLVETPTYLGGLQSFSQYEPCYQSVASDEAGLIPETLTTEQLQQASFMYTIPNFQNPTGRRLPLARRQQLASLAKQHDLILVEDDPYGELDYQGKRLPSLFSLAPHNTIYLGSFSKILTPGFRLGYMIADETMINKLVQLKQAADLHTPSFTQRIAYHAIKDGFLEQHIPQIRQLYGERCQYMLQALQRYMPDTVSWSKPEGGMFIWLTLPAQINATELLHQAIAKKVAFVPGETFFANDPKTHCLRLAFVTVEPAKIEQGIATLAELIKQY